METNKIEQDELFNHEFLLKLRTKKLHLICPAKFKDSYCTEYLVGHLGMSVYDVEKYCNAVNQAKDPGCLYPMHTVTLFPVAEGLDLNKCMESVLKAQTDYFKCPDVLIVFDKQEYLDNEALKKQFDKLFSEYEGSSGKYYMYFE
jgi:hypothetical protein